MTLDSHCNLFVSTLWDKGNGTIFREAKAYITGATRTVTMQMQYCYKGNFTKETSYTLYSKEMYEKHHYSQIEVYNIITQIHTI